MSSHVRVFFAVLIFSFQTGHIAWAQAPTSDVLRAKFETEVQKLADGLDGVVGVSFIDLATGESFGVNDDLVFTQASAIKIPILVELLKQSGAGRFSLDDPMTIKAADITRGSGILQQLTPGAVTMTIRDVATLMIVVSDNTATNMMIDLVGMERVNATMQEFKLSSTRLQRKMMDTEAWQQDRENLSTPNEAAWLIAALYHGDILDRQRCDEILRILSIPKRSQIRARLPDDIRVAHKTGSVGGVVVDNGIVYIENRPFVVAVMTNWVTDYDAAASTIAEITRVGYDYFSRLGSGNEYGHTL
ncbi:MAG: serine hydrolase [Woeseia sp.]|jgi:beta-lactamase class A|nr:serine hydrolase [Woeseia sp.]MBT6210633.1 serine hydrolase [Woeseia sp.]